MLFLSCSTICFRLQPIETALDEIRRAGFAAIDLALVPGFCDHFDGIDCTPAEREDFVALVRQSGLAVPTVTSVPGHFNADGASHAQIVQAARGHLKIAALLGASAVNLHCGLPEARPGRWMPALARQASGLAAIAREAAALDLRVNIEAPHRNGLCRTLDQSLALVDAIDEPNVYHLLDVTHVHAGGASPLDAVTAFGRRLGHVHLRDARGDDIFHVPGRGEIAFRPFFAALGAAGYAGTCAVELESPGETLPERRAALVEALEFLLAQGSLELAAVSPVVEGTRSRSRL